MTEETTVDTDDVKSASDLETQRWLTRRTAIRWSAVTVMFVSFFAFLTALTYILATHPVK